MWLLGSEVGLETVTQMSHRARRVSGRAARRMGSHRYPVASGERPGTRMPVAESRALFTLYLSHPLG